MSFEEHDTDTAAARGSEWRHLSEPIVARCFLGEAWVDATVIDINRVTGEVMVEWPPQSEHHRVLDPSHHRLPRSADT